MKRRCFLAVGLAAVMALTLASGIPAAAEEETKDASEYTIYNILRFAGDSYWDSIAEGAARYAEETGCNVINSSPTEFDSAAQLQILQDAIAQKPDAIVLTPIENDPCEPLLKQAMEEGILVVTCQGRDIVNKDWDIETIDTVKYGEHVIDRMAEALGEKGNYIMTVGSLSYTGQITGIQAGIDRQKELYPDMNLLCDITAPNEGTADAALSFYKELITSYPDVDGIFAFESTVQCAQAVEEAGLAGEVAVMGYALADEAEPYLKDGSLTMSCINDPITYGAVSVAFAVELLNGTEPEDGMDLGYNGYDACAVDPETKIVEGSGIDDITAENVEDFLL